MARRWVGEKTPNQYENQGIIPETNKKTKSASILCSSGGDYPEER